MTQCKKVILSIAYKKKIFNTTDMPSAVTIENTNNLALQYQEAIDVATIVSKTDLKGRIKYANDEFCRISGFNRDELMGRPHNIVRHKDMPKEAFKDMWATIKSKQPWLGIVKNKTKYGGSYWVNTTVYPILNSEDASIDEYIAIRSNITELEEQKVQFENLIEASRKFVPEKLLELIEVSDITNISADSGRTIEASILFMDILDFTGISEKQDPALVFQDLNQLFRVLEPCILENDGVIDKYVGDGIMAIFVDAHSAVQAGILMKERLDIFNQDRAKIGKDPFNIGVGIHSGPVMMGTVGTDRRMNVTVIGDAVNTASRIERLTRKIKGHLLISEETLLKASQISDLKNQTRPVGKVLLKGKSKPIRVFTVV